MKEEKLEFKIKRYSNSEELLLADQSLLKAAIKAAKKAYADYSEFYVGCALMLESGTVICGNNQENTAYPSGLCAERVALFYASANYPNDKILTAVIYAFSENYPLKNCISPCGNCRQVFLEYEKKQCHPIRILMAASHSEIFEISQSQDLLPLFFYEDKLKK